MFVVLLTYTQPPDVVEALIPAHRDYLRRMYQAGIFLLSGKQRPPDGGVILARAESARALETMLAEDPFSLHGAASYQIVEFVPLWAAPLFQPLLAVEGGEKG